MPADMYTVNRTKELILAFIRARGPSLPVHIARDVKTSPLFSAAFLSELYNEGKIKMSALKVGSSSLYYIIGQEAQLENSIQHLNTREKEAVALLKKAGMLEDANLEPVVRVALRAVKDFAIPLQIPVEDGTKLYWKYFTLPDTETPQLLAAAQKITVPQEKISEPTAPLLAPTAAPSQVSALICQEPRTKVEGVSGFLSTVENHHLLPTKVERLHGTEGFSKSQSPSNHSQEQTPSPIPAKKLKSPPRPRAPSEHLPQPVLTLPFPATTPPLAQNVIEFPFVNTIKMHLNKRNMSVTQSLLEQKKEYRAKIKLDTSLGQQEYFLIAKDKKRLKADELIEALQKAHIEKMPALLLAPGDLDKQAKTMLAEWGNLIKFEKLE